MLQSLKIKSLFGLYSYDLQFRVCDKDAITFITGPNGYGKTTILSLINALYAYDLDLLMTIPFDVLTFAFDGESGMIVEIAQRRHTEQEDGSDVTRSSSVTLHIVFRKASANNIVQGGELDHFEVSNNDTQWKERESQLRLYMQSLPCYYIKDQRLLHKAAALMDEALPQQATLPAVCDNAQELKRELVRQQTRYNEIFQTPPPSAAGSSEG